MADDGNGPDVVSRRRGVGGRGLKTVKSAGPARGPTMGGVGGIGRCVAAVAVATTLASCSSSPTRRPAVSTTTTTTLAAAPATTATTQVTVAGPKQACAVMPQLLGAVSQAVDANDVHSLVADNGAQIAALHVLADPSSGAHPPLSTDASAAAGHLSAAATANNPTDAHAALQALDTSLQTVIADCQSAGY